MSFLFTNQYLPCIFCTPLFYLEIQASIWKTFSIKRLMFLVDFVLCFHQIKNRGCLEKLHNHSKPYSRNKTTENGQRNTELIELVETTNPTADCVQLFLVSQINMPNLISIYSINVQPILIFLSPLKLPYQSSRTTSLSNHYHFFSIYCTV